jgi:hypothetical protein
MPAPTIDPQERKPIDVAPTSSYHAADRVWVYRAGTWRAGVVEAASSRAATITYLPGDTPGTAVDTLTAEYLLPRTDIDHRVDPKPHPRP